MNIRIGTRGSKLALWQAHLVRDLLGAAGHQADLVVYKTTGDVQTDAPLYQLGEAGLFTKALDDALILGDVDIAVHSAKDIPTQIPPELSLLAFLEREDPRDVLLAVSEEVDFDNLSREFVVGTSSLRRQALLAHYLPHFKAKSVRGNVDTRVAKLEAGEYDALLLAHAGVKRMGYTHLVRRKMNPETFTPAVGQGAIAVVARNDLPGRDAIRHLLNHAETEWAVRAERAFLHRMQGGCHSAIFALATVVEGTLSLSGGIAAQDGSKVLRDHVHGPTQQAETLGQSLADIIINQGIGDILNG